MLSCPPLSQLIIGKSYCYEMLGITWSRRISENQKSKKSFPVKNSHIFLMNRIKSSRKITLKSPGQRWKLSQVLQSCVYDRSMALEQPIITSSAEFQGGNSPPCHRTDPPPQLSSLSGFPELHLSGWQTPNIFISFPLFQVLYWNHWRQSNWKQNTLLPCCAAVIGSSPTVPKFSHPNHLFTAELLGSYTQNVMLLWLSAFHRKA